MISSFKKYKITIFTIVFTFVSFLGFSQVDTSTLKAQIALGVQYMFKSVLGVKLDFGYNRFSNVNNTPEFKVNYSRLNTQLVYDTKGIFGILPQRIEVFAHAGPGFSMVKPLGNYPENKTSYLNIMTGLEFHYGINDSLSFYIDGSYIAGFSNDFIPVSKGFGSFNGNMLNLTFGVSLSLTGCYYCGNE